MKARYFLILLSVLVLGLTSAAAHKYYVAVFQMEHVPEKKVIQVTSRIFIDDMEATLHKKYKKNFYLGSPKELPESEVFLKKYFAENIQVKVNGITKNISYLGKETEDDILICYLTIACERKVKTIQVKNSVLFDFFPDQQNYIHFNTNRNKKSLLLTNDDKEGILEF